MASSPPAAQAIKGTSTREPPSQSDTYTYDQAGNTTSRTVGTKTQTFTWDSEGSLTQISEGSTTTSFLYDADGDRLIRREPNTTTLYLPSGMELALDKTANTIKGTRYYSHNGDTVAVRQGGTVQYLMDDHQGTAEIAINGTTYATTTRRTTPFGAPRGTNPAPWPGQRGFVGGTNDPSTGLVRLGAREYDPSTGRFITVDPIIDKDVPQQMNGYSYADNNPVTFSDPTGLCATCSGVDGTVVHPKTKKRIKGNTSSNPKYANSGVPTRKKVVLNSHHTKKSLAQAKRNQAKMKRERQATTKRRVAAEKQSRQWEQKIKALQRAHAKKNRPKASGSSWKDLVGNFLIDASAGIAIGRAAGWRGRVSMPVRRVAPRSGEWFPKRSLPKDSHGNWVPDSQYPHTQLGWKNGGKGPYPQAREWGAGGELKKDIDFTDHGRPANHTNPHEHRWLDNSTGGAKKRQPAEPWIW
ncbi:RHS repeat domain-containing protein [Nonomuraea sp. NPDC059194]|uniref:RHS repeat domain-containing protein n=1 Tax=Nonomuraea sp. NPDC059194 TaxID=3346764 RepID=UPI0036C9F126